MKSIQRPAVWAGRVAFRDESGFTLIEVMVALLIGMGVVGAALASYVATGRSSRMQLAYTEMNENAQIGLTLLVRDLQSAGYARPMGIVSGGAGLGSGPVMMRPYAARPVFGCVHGLVQNSYRNRVAPWDASVCAPASSEQDHVIEIVYEADLANSSPTATAVPSDCIGSGLPVSDVAVGGSGGTLSYYLARNRYYLAVSSAGRAELHCASAQGASGQPLVDNVEAMRFWYGEASAAEPWHVARYVGADAVADWSRVLSVRVCLLMRSSAPVLGEDDPRDYLDCDGVDRIATDLHARRTYYTTAALRNKIRP